MPMAASFQTFHRVYNNLPTSEAVVILEATIPQSKPDGYVEIIHIPVTNYGNQIEINRQIRQSFLERNNVPFDLPTDTNFFLDAFGTRPAHYLEVVGRVLPETTEKMVELSPLS